MGQTAAIALLNGKYKIKHTPKYFFSCYYIFVNVSFAFERQGDNKNLIFGGKSLVFMFAWVVALALAALT